ncbi:hypothetical protein PtrSN002B_007489 [Pyrenophora tritici-repentis]|uniref:Uncharacterized protein n=1 Tax=Pyrenophora tritici-repentis TaxID=45151 RepID=A0A2W1EPJ1_9PLEO|nr:hypothetical protein PtrV1_09322 [Pyrenophora tritici-repentis]KAF7443234.1 hypothetical protein A1F99_127410 [Pyrenophora tritici-repentis]KAF7568289.1 hypothetical protein PtrM4_129020 [Pyrenophora tritici-repentis]KAG9377076.1 hypothetical protein A1F94_012676 [Pyrenophora tritici-repentis]KAI0586961.1 hypothetical protein Alg215_01698 [Pyrenophora tritici-repentis]
MARFFFTLILSTAALVAGQTATCPNEVAIYNQQDRTMTATLSWFVVPVPKEDIMKALRESIPNLVTLQGLNLLPIPEELDFPVGMHPVLVSAGMNGDIRQGGFQLATGLMVATSMIPYVGIGSSNTPFNAPLVSYLAGVDEVTQGYVFGLIPSVVATIGGLLTRVGAFIPMKAPLQAYSDGSLGINSKWAQAPNPVTGPGLYSEAIDLKFVSEPNQASPRYSLSIWKRLINQPLILGNLDSVFSTKCQRNTVFFTNSTAQPTYRSGNVTLGPSAGASVFSAVLQKASPDGSGFYQSVYGLSACAQTVGYGSPVVPLGEDCEKAATAVSNTPGAL